MSECSLRQPLATSLRLESLNVIQLETKTASSFQTVLCSEKFLKLFVLYKFLVIDRS